MTSLLTLTPAGLHCERGGFHVDPWRPVGRALITHAHADHARGGSAAYLAPREGLPVLRRVHSVNPPTMMWIAPVVNDDSSEAR